ncbi:SDR family oxidoreductase [Leifsonia sp. 1010]|uniref:SDR family oxidoreductase n=1 Tax=Leifsonia sp. 1010 TaxID=2817769 RepID=UPI002865F7FB|nr:SDR family oxidoreductase [Leifsonia sp. 1010]MDR6611294.1 nucleoside-diphosphate-sugar epimerase [Leifsonia sp. 1010]
MRVFITGGSGWIGSAAVPELLVAGHEVRGLARSDASAARLRSAGVEPISGGLGDLEVLRASAAEADAVIHLGYNHDFSDQAGAGRSERAALEAFGDALKGRNAPLLFASGTAFIAPGRIATEDDRAPFSGPDAPRGGAEELAFGFVDRGIHPVALRFAPTVHGAGDHGFTAELVRVAREKGVAGYVGDGSNHWPAVYRGDAARLVVRALENAGTATVVHAIAEQGVPTRDIAEAIGAGLGVPAASIDPADVDAHFGWIGRIFALDLRASSALTQRRFDWEPTGPTLLEDLAAGSYFARPAA